MTPRPMNTAPRDQTLVRLLIDYTGDDVGFTALEDEMQAWTIGFNGLDHTGDDRWQFVGWSWTHDHFLDATESGGRPIGWLPFYDDKRET